METTISILNEEANWEKVLPSAHYIVDHYRVLAANRLMVKAEDWIKWLVVVNSGTYPSTWMITDLELFEKAVGKDTLLEGTFYVAEQIPGIVHFADMSDYIS